jgi:NTP pyrophosphatase (non-canonical NTP hydrolase)
MGVEVKTYDYQELVDRRASSREMFENIEYLNCGLIGETGELAEEVKKMLRDDSGALTDARRAAIQTEAGDVLWYLSAITTRCGLFLPEVLAHLYFESVTPRLSTMSAASRIKQLAADVSAVTCVPDEGTIQDAFLTLVDVCDWAGVTIDDVAIANFSKIEGRLARGTIGGSGER